MDLKKLVGIVLCFGLVALASCSRVSSQSASPPKIEGMKIVVKGKIDYLKNYGGYYVAGEDPPGAFFVVNQDPKLLEELFKTQKMVIISGHLTIGADHLFIEKIDDKPYQGAEAK
ncbi:MAG: hypothetical protein MUO29_05810 [Desulfobacterales bacterium]|nr:hypothetical protein [Desulfobacterales bacterium]